MLGLIFLIPALVGCFVAMFFAAKTLRLIQRRPQATLPTGTITRIESVVNSYLARDPFDYSSTEQFLQEVDALDDPFDEIPRTVFNSLRLTYRSQSLEDADRVLKEIHEPTYQTGGLLARRTKERNTWA